MQPASILQTTTPIPLKSQVIPTTQCPTVSKPALPSTVDEASLSASNLRHWVFHTWRASSRSTSRFPLVYMCYAFEVEFVGAIHSIDHAWEYGWIKLWLMSRSKFPNVVAIIHIHYKGNRVVDSPTLRARSNVASTWWWQHRIPEKNFGVFHSYRSVGHFFSDYLIKRQCPRCMHEFQKFLEVERDTFNKGKFFKCCNMKCRFCNWCKDGETIYESSNTCVTLAKLVAHEEIDDMSRMFQSQVRLNNEEGLLISVNVNVIVHREKLSAKRKTEGDKNGLNGGLCSTGYVL